MRVALLVLMIAMGVARADDAADARAEAKLLAEDAFRKIKDSNDYPGAIDLFARAYELTKDPTYLLNIAISARKGNLPQQAVAMYRRYVEVLGEGISAETRDQVAAEIAVITRVSATIVVTTAGAPAEIQLDHRSAGIASKAAPLAVLADPAGGYVHELRAQRAGYEDAIRAVGNLEPNTSIAVEIEPKLKPTTGRLTITSTPDGARLAHVRGNPIGAAPQSLVLAPGDYDIVASLSGREDHLQHIHLAPGDDQRVLMRLDPTWWTKHGTAVWIAAGVTLVVAGILVYAPIRDQFKPDGLVSNYP